MSLLARLAALERFRADGGYTDAEIRARTDRLARAMDLPADELYDLTRRYLRIGPDAALRELAAELGVSVEEARRQVEATMGERS